MFASQEMQTTHIDQGILQAFLLSEKKRLFKKLQLQQSLFGVCINVYNLLR